MVNKQPEALRLADVLTDSHLPVHHKAAAELRRLYEENVQMREQRDELLEAMKRIAVAAEATVCNVKWVARHCRSAIAKAEGERS